MFVAIHGFADGLSGTEAAYFRDKAVLIKVVLLTEWIHGLFGHEVEPRLERAIHAMVAALLAA